LLLEYGILDSSYDDDYYDVSGENVSEYNDDKLAKAPKRDKLAKAPERDKPAKPHKHGKPAKLPTEIFNKNNRQSFRNRRFASGQAIVGKLLGKDSHRRSIMLSHYVANN
jgi:hypothetical protein